MDNKIESYSAASIIPTKLFHINSIKKGKIKPLHIQLIPTNKCNLNCPFCSCGDRDRQKELTFEEIIKILDICAKYGTKAITVTGGGEPLFHPKINQIFRYAHKKGMQIGLVTNGTTLNRLQEHKNLTWCRISSADNRIPAYKIISAALKVNPHTDWAFSHVITNKPNYSIMRHLIKFANNYNFTHIRLVSDLCDLDNVPSMDEIKLNLSLVNDSKVIYQGRKESTRGTKKCYISLLKPVIAPEGIFGCCGAQYAIHGQKKDFIDKMKMGELSDLKNIFEQQKYFDGSICDICYYKSYNEILSKLLSKPDHLEFV